jgi:hypothetical protein
MGSNDDADPGQTSTSAVTFTAAAGTTYWIAVDGYKGGVGAPATGRVAVHVKGDQPPVASFSFAPGRPIAGQRVAFDGTPSSDLDGDGLAYRWAFGDGATGTGPTPSHVFAAAGSYNVALTVSDGKGGAAIRSQAVAVRPNTLARTLKLLVSAKSPQRFLPSGDVKLTVQCANKPCTLETAAHVTVAGKYVTGSDRSASRHHGTKQFNLTIHEPAQVRQAVKTGLANGHHSSMVCTLVAIDSGGTTRRVVKKIRLTSSGTSHRATLSVSGGR